jgi:hypothetical protein
MTTVPQQWRKSSRSSSQTNCVELASTLHAVRDSKNPTGPTLAVDLGAFVQAAKAGKLDR